MLRGEPGLLTDADSQALSNAVTTPADRSVVREHIEVCLRLCHWVQEAKLAVVIAERDLYRAISLLVLLGHKGTLSKEEQVLSKDIEMNLRLSLIVWFAHCAVIELLSEYLWVDFTELLEVPRQSLMNVVDLYNVVLDLAPRLALPKALSALRLRPIDIEELQPAKEWREELAEETRGGIGPRWFAKALETWFDGEALGLPIGSAVASPPGEKLV